MRFFSAQSAAPAPVAWALLARPGRWAEWAPHVRGAWGLGSPEVELGARGYVRLLGAVPVPARITAKEAGRSWTWKVGPVEMMHEVVPVNGSSDGSEIRIGLDAPGPLGPGIAATYGPLVAVLVKRLANVAERSGRQSALR